MGFVRIIIILFLPLCIFLLAIAPMPYLNLVREGLFEFSKSVDETTIYWVAALFIGLVASYFLWGVFLGLFLIRKYVLLAGIAVIIGLPVAYYLNPENPQLKQLASLAGRIYDVTEHSVKEATEMGGELGEKAKKAKSQLKNLSEEAVEKAKKVKEVLEE